MRRWFALLGFLSWVTLSSAAVFAADRVPSLESVATVKLFFVNQFLPERQSDQPVGGGAGGFGSAGTLMFETADLFLDDRFVSNVMFRHIDVMPTLNLPSGDHVFRIECEGYRKFEKTLTVLGNGSVQHLVVRLQREPKGALGSESDSAKH